MCNSATHSVFCCLRDWIQVKCWCLLTTLPRRTYFMFFFHYFCQAYCIEEQLCNVQSPASANIRSAVSNYNNAHLFNVNFSVPALTDPPKSHRVDFLSSFLHIRNTFWQWRNLQSEHYEQDGFQTKPVMAIDVCNLSDHKNR